MDTENIPHDALCDDDPRYRFLGSPPPSSAAPSTGRTGPPTPPQVENLPSQE